MTTYKHILLALDLSDESEQVAAKGVALAKTYDAKLSIIHVIEPLSYAYGGDIPMDFSNIQEEIHKQAKTQLQKFGEHWSIAEAGQHLMVGKPESKIHIIAKEEDVDLIVVGSHGRHGLALIFGSTANGVLHGAECDVLAVRVNS